MGSRRCVILIWLGCHCEERTLRRREGFAFTRNLTRYTTKQYDRDRVLDPGHIGRGEGSELTEDLTDHCGG